MAEFRMKAGDRFVMIGSSLMVWSWLGLLSVVLASLLGGQAFKESIFGDIAMGVFFAGFFGGSMLLIWGLRHRREDVAPVAEALKEGEMSHYLSEPN